MDEKQKSTALELLKKYYENFYLQNAATNPDKVKNIRYFIDWLNDSAKPADITEEEHRFFIRNCTFSVNIAYWFRNGTSNKYYVTGTVSALVADDQKFADYFSDVYYSPEANSKIVPGNIADIAAQEAKKLLYASYNNTLFSDAKIQSYEITDPAENNYLLCTVNYPHPVADKNGSHIRSFQFITWNDQAYLTTKQGPENAEDKPQAEKKGCYIATSVYGSYDCPQVWTLRRYRDFSLRSTAVGRLFVKFYYAVSPTLVKLFGKQKWFRSVWKRALDKKVEKLNARGYQNTPYNDM